MVGWWGEAGQGKNKQVRIMKLSSYAMWIERKVEVRGFLAGIVSGRQDRGGVESIASTAPLIPDATDLLSVCRWMC
jgi:hypothetical protein